MGRKKEQKNGQTGDLRGQTVNTARLYVMFTCVFTYGRLTNSCKHVESTYTNFAPFHVRLPPTVSMLVHGTERTRARARERRARYDSPRLLRLSPASKK